MNKLKNLFLLGLVAVSSATFVSCEKSNENDDQKPSLALVKPSSKEVTVEQGATVDVEVLAASSDKKLESFRVEFSQSGGPFAAYTGAFPAGKNDTTLSDANFTYKKTLPTLAGEGTITYRFYAVDKDGNSNSLDLKITVTQPAGATISSYSAKMVGGQDNATVGSFLATTTGVVYKIADAKANSGLVDLLYYFGANNKASIAAPDDADAATVYNGASGPATWTTKNATRMEISTVTPATFNSMANSTALVLSYGLTNPTGTDVNQLAVDNVIKFRTAAGKRGFALVKSITTGGTGTIQVDVKVEK